MLYSAIHDPDLVAIGGVAAGVATLLLATFAAVQMKLAQRQVTAAQDQVAIMKKSAEDQIAALKETTEQELTLVREQIEAAKTGNDAVGAAARAQLQPIVFAHGIGRRKRAVGISSATRSRPGDLGSRTTWRTRASDRRST